jgi:hypothetical protein
MNQFFETRERKIRYETIEIYHPAVGVLRYVNKQFYDKNFTLESSADRNAGESVTFTAGNFEVQHPDVSEDGVMSMQVQLGRIGTTVKQYVKQIRDYSLLNPNTTPAEFVYREFVDNVPSVFNSWIGGITISGDSVAIIASDDNPASINVSTRYLSQNYPGLRVII